jgi:hypothetical protein
VPWILPHSKPFSTRAEVIRWELYFKTGRGRDELERLTSPAHLGAAL